MDSGRSRRPLAVTVNEMSITGQIDIVRLAAEVNADWIILQPPLVKNVPESELVAFLGAVAEKAPLPVAIQNNRMNLDVWLSSSSLKTLHRNHANITLLKGEGTIDYVRQLIEETEGVFHVSMGTAALKRLHASILPLLTYILASPEHMLCYGKRMLARRIGLNEVHPRHPCILPTSFGDMARFFHSWLTDACNAGSQACRDAGRCVRDRGADRWCRDQRGLLLAPMLMSVAGMDARQAIDISMATGLVALWLFARGQAAISNRWVLIVATMLGALAGALAFWALFDGLAVAVLALFLVTTGIRLLYSGPAPDVSCRPASALVDTQIGAVAGFFSALTGTGGPMVLVPLLVWRGAPLMTAVAVGQLVQLPISGVVTLGNYANGDVDSPWPR